MLIPVPVEGRHDEEVESTLRQAEQNEPHSSPERLPRTWPTLLSNLWPLLSWLAYKEKDYL